MEFAIEDARALKLRADRQLRQVQKHKCTSVDTHISWSTPVVAWLARPF